MPVYVYRNLSTGRTFEVEQRITEPALTSDPTTGDPVKRLIQPVGIAFKGSGFYVTDSRNGARTGATAPKSERSSSDGGAATGTVASQTPTSTGSGSNASAGAAAD
jgi:predicted nucleic acid-binding Zn ribbon protein